MNYHQVMKSFVALIVVASLVLAGCSDSHRQIQQKRQVKVDRVMLTVETSGGLCVTGACSSTLKLKQGGSWTLRVGNQTSYGDLPAGPEGLVVATILHSQRSDLVSGPFTGTCPTAYDGQQTVWTLRRSDKDIMVDSCKDQIRPHAAFFKALATAAASGWQAPSNAR